MVYHFLANFVVIYHLVFVIFVVLGGFLVIKWRSLAWLHVPAFLWGALIEFTGWWCPLTPLENWLRAASGEQVYRGDFIDHYLFPLLYPANLTRDAQKFLGILVLLVNLGLYGWILWRTAQKQARGKSSPS